MEGCQSENPMVSHIHPNGQICEQCPDCEQWHVVIGANEFGTWVYADNVEEAWTKAQAELKERRGN